MKILFVDPYETNILNFRKELLDSLISAGHDVFLATNYSKTLANLYEKRVAFLWTNCDLRSKSIINNVSLYYKYKKIIKNGHFDLILSFTVKPNIYCAFHSKRTPIITNITGLGMAFSGKGLISRLIKKMYKKAFKNVDCVFFQNQKGYDVFKESNIPINHFRIIPGSGVNTTKFTYVPFSCDSHAFSFLYASRFIKEKGIGLLLEAIPTIIEKHNKTVFVFVGDGEHQYVQTIEEYVEKWPNNIMYYKWTNNMTALYRESTFLILPSFYNEGISNVLLESLATGRPIITTEDNPGCMELLNNNKNGIGIKSNDLKSLLLGIEKACSLSCEEIKQMGLSGRKFVVEHFNRKQTINIYLSEMEKLVVLNSSKEEIK